MGRSRVDLANEALALLVRGPIRDLEGPKPEQVHTSQHMDQAIEEVIAEYDWPECRVISAATAAALTTDTLRGWTYAFVYPSDCVKLWGLTPTAKLARPELSVSYELGMSADVTNDTTYIFSDEAAPYLRYGSRRVSLSRLSPHVFDLAAKRLAMKACMAITKNAKLFSQLRGIYREDLNHAKVLATATEPEFADIDFTPELISVRSQ